jgi:5-methylcytosine-specific restriction endonuclease McrA
VHGGGACVVCHADAKAPHGKLAKVSCGRCHADAARSYARSSHGRLPAKGVTNAPACHDCHGKHDIRKSRDPAARTFRLNIAAECLRCHRDRPGAAKSGPPERKVMIAYAQSVHGMASKAGQLGSAVCSDCHGNHAILPGDNPKSATNRQNIATLCGKCHSGILGTYEGSVHGKGMRAGIPESPVCTDCHGEHTISKIDDPGSPVAPRNIPRTCSRCHDKEGISSRYAIPKRRFSSYMDSFHGIAVEYGMTTAANCASCHGVHDILPSSDPASSVNKANLPKTCGRCHPNAGPNFAKGPVHVEVSASKSPGVFAIRLFYTLFISALMILFLLHVGFELYGRWTRWRDGRPGGKEGRQ